MRRSQRIADRLVDLETVRFTGRSAILDDIDRLLSGEDSASVLLVHGPSGIGKSAVLREIQRRAEKIGRQTWSLDGRLLEPLPRELESALQGAIKAPTPIVMIDSFERVEALAEVLRNDLLPRLDAGALVVIAGRWAPDPGWFRDGWEHMTREIRVTALSDDEARVLLDHHGVKRQEDVDAIVEWANGSPLALETGASAALSPGGLRLDHINLNEMIIRRVAGKEIDRLDADVAEVAAVARAVDGRLLSAVLPGRPTREAYRSLTELSFAEPIGGVLTLHSLVREALQSHLREQEPNRYDDLKRRIADHLYSRATTGEPRLLMDLVELIDSPEIRWGLGADSGADIRVEAWRPGHMDDVISRYIKDLGDPTWWQDLEPLLEQAPEMGLVARDGQGKAVSFCVATTPETAPAIAWDDPVFGRLLQDAADSGRRTFVWRESHFFHDIEKPTPFALLNTASILRSGIANVDLSYIVDIQDDEESQVFFEAVGAHRRPDLEGFVDPSRRNPCWVIDHGPGGMLGSIRASIYAETGVAPASPDREIMRGAALDALRDLYRPESLSSNLLAEGSNEVERCEHVRKLLVEATQAAFNDTAQERLMRSVVELGDLDPIVTHKQAMVELAVSRTTYYRRLAEARERVASTLVGRLLDE